MTEEAWTRRRAEIEGDGEKLLPRLVILKTEQRRFGQLEAEREATAGHAPHCEMRDTRSAVAVGASIIWSLHHEKRARIIKVKKKKQKMYIRLSNIKIHLLLDCQILIGPAGLS